MAWGGRSNMDGPPEADGVRRANTVPGSGGVERRAAEGGARHRSPAGMRNPSLPLCISL